MLSCDGVRRRQRQAVLAATGWIEQTVQIGLGGGVGQAKSRETCQRATLRRLRTAGLNQEAAALRNNGARVQDQVHDDLLDLRGIGLDAPASGSGWTAVIIRPPTAVSISFAILRRIAFRLTISD